MQSGTVDAGKINIRVIKKLREIGSSENDCVNSIATEEPASKRGQSPTLFFRAFPCSSQLDIRVVNVIYLLWQGANDLDLWQMPEKR